MAADHGETGQPKPLCRRCEGVTAVPTTTIYLCPKHKAQEDAVMASIGDVVFLRRLNAPPDGIDLSGGPS